MKISKILSIMMAFSLIFTLVGCGEEVEPEPEFVINIVNEETAIEAESLKVPAELKRRNLLLRSFNDGYRIFTVERRALNPKFGDSETVELIVYDTNNQRVAAYKHLDLTNGRVHDAIFKDEKLYYTVDTSNYHVVYVIDGVETVEVMKDVTTFDLMETEEGICFSYRVKEGEEFEYVTNLITSTGYREISRQVLSTNIEKHKSGIDGAKIVAVMEDYYIRSTYNRDIDESVYYAEHRQTGKTAEFFNYKILNEATDGKNTMAYRISTSTDRTNALTPEERDLLPTDKGIYILYAKGDEVTITPVETGLKLVDYTMQCKVDEGRAFIIMSTDKRTGNRLFIIE